MTRHYFTHSFGIDSGGDTSNLPPAEDLSVVIEGIYLAIFAQTSASGPVSLEVSGLRDVHSAAGAAQASASFLLNPSTTELAQGSFPVRGRTNEGDGVAFALGATSPDVAAGTLTVWGYYTDE